MLRSIIIAGLGSFIGGACRFLLAKTIDTHSSTTFPWGTLAVNLLGCLIIGFIYGLIERHLTISPSMRLFLTVGFCGGFTTFSTFIHESLTLISGSGILLAATYAAASLFLGLICAWLGHYVAMP